MLYDITAHRFIFFLRYRSLVSEKFEFIDLLLMVIGLIAEKKSFPKDFSFMFFYGTDDFVVLFIFYDEDISFIAVKDRKMYFPEMKGHETGKSYEEPNIRLSGGDDKK